MPALPPGATPIKGRRAPGTQQDASRRPHRTTFRDAGRHPDGHAGRAERAGGSRKISFTHLIGWAIVRAASDAPAMTYYFLEADGSAYRVDPVA